ncbi:hypothetical protein E4U17_007526 [Claviceps sp. LM77 group G4]|nr:hypothetical protein E4U17_007526 [Claviceps sp. LM77 group G4]
MASGTRSSARGSEAPEPRGNNDQHVAPLTTGAPTATTPTDDQMAALRRRLEAEADRRALDQANISSPAPKAQGSAGPGTPLTDLAETSGENWTPIVLKVHELLVGVAPDDINDVCTGKFEPWSLIRFHRTRGVRPSYDEPSSTIDVSTSGALTVKKKNYTAADYGPNPVVWASAFINYMFVYEHLFHESPTTTAVRRAMNRFLEFMLDKSEAYQWKFCIAYAMRHHQAVKANSIHSPEAWLHHPRIKLDHDFNHFSALTSQSAQSASQKRQRSNTAQTCKNFNNPKGCTRCDVRAEKWLKSWSSLIRGWWS